jgi:xanthine dehydrogenase accessory factor
VPEVCIDDALAHSAFLIMTHDHALDLRLCERVLARTDFVYCGLIGSRTKRTKFMHRLSARGFSAAAIERITCPIGLPQLSGKAPFEVAIATAAQLLQVANGERMP